MAALRDVIDAMLKRRITDAVARAAILNESSGSWTPVIRGSGTAGTYELNSTLTKCRYQKIGRRVFLDGYITFASSITGGGTGYMQITGVPYPKVADCYCSGAVFHRGLDIVTAGAKLTVHFTTLGAGTFPLYLFESVDNGLGADFAISGVSANDDMNFSINYETDS